MTKDNYLPILKTLIKLPQEYHDDEQLLLLITPCTNHAIGYLVTKKEKENLTKEHIEKALDIEDIQIAVSIMVRYHYDNQGQYMNKPQYPDIVYDILYYIKGSFKLD